MVTPVFLFLQHTMLFISRNRRTFDSNTNSTAFKNPWSGTKNACKIDSYPDKIRSDHYKDIKTDLRIHKKWAIDNLTILSVYNTESFHKSSTSIDARPVAIWNN